MASVKDTVNELLVMPEKLKEVGDSDGSMVKVEMVKVAEDGDDPVAFADRNLTW